MRLVKYDKDKNWEDLLKRPVTNPAKLRKSVASILRTVASGGDRALRRYTKQFDKVYLRTFEVSNIEFKSADRLLHADTKAAIQTAKRNIEKFHAAQAQPELPVETMPGVVCWRKSVPIEKVGLYIPGGTAPLFSTLLMLGVPARLAGCKQIVVCSPPGRNGSLHPAILYTARLLKIERIFKVGGAQAIAAMTYGTRSVPAVFKIFGPGNQYITCAKQLVQQSGMVIDMPAGPSEVAIYADEYAQPSFVAADLLSQAEHGADSQVILVTNARSFALEVRKEISRQLPRLSRRLIAGKSLANSKIILVRERQEAIDLLNLYAPEHLILSCHNARSLAEKVKNAGSVFLGNFSPESVGDYASGTNHTLPTNGYARCLGGVSVDSFVKKITFQQLSRNGLAQLAKTVELMALAEGLDGHAQSVRVRMQP